MRFFLNGTAFFTCDFVKLFTWCDCDLYRYIIKSHIVIMHEWVWNPFMCHPTCSNALQLHHMNSRIDIHTAHFLSQSHSQKIALCERALSLLSLKKDLGNLISTGHINRRTSISKFYTRQNMKSVSGRAILCEFWSHRIRHSLPLCKQ